MVLEKIEEVLKQSGFSKQECQEFLDCTSYQQQCQCLGIKRQKILDDIHKKEKQITNLDYLKYKIECEKTIKRK